MWLQPLTLLLLLGVLSAPARAAFCSGKPNPAAQPNLNPLDLRAPVHVRSVPNASLYQVGCPGEDCISIVHLWGTPYEKVSNIPRGFDKPGRCRQSVLFHRPLMSGVMVL